MIIKECCEIKKETQNNRVGITLVGEVVLKGGVDVDDPAHILRVLQPVADGAPGDPAGEDPLVGCQALHQHVDVPGDVLIDGEEVGSRAAAAPGGGACCELLLVL